MKKYYCCMCGKEIEEETKVVDMELGEDGNIILKDSTNDDDDVLNFCSFDCLYNHIRSVTKPLKE